MIYAEHRARRASALYAIPIFGKSSAHLIPGPLRPRVEPAFQLQDTESHDTNNACRVACCSVNQRQRFPVLVFMIIMLNNIITAITMMQP
jgi:hypothetical protein